jgi:hypothetical protein
VAPNPRWSDVLGWGRSGGAARGGEAARR